MHLACQIDLDTEEKCALRFSLEHGSNAPPVELFCNHVGMALLSAILTVSFSRNDWHELRALRSSAAVFASAMRGFERGGGVRKVRAKGE